MNSVQNVRWRALCGVSGLALVLGCAGVAQAQSAEEAGPLSEVVVTASRIVRDGYEAPTPTTVLGAAELQKQAPANVADLVNKMPQLGSSVSPRTTGARAGGTGGANLLNLRGLGTTRTLVLLDGRRVVPSLLTQAIDVNLLPTQLVQRVDIVTGGASAAYGSDAVAGVVNFVLDTKFQGMKLNLATGRTWKGDGENYNADLSLGKSFMDGRLHVLVSGSYAKVEDIPRIDSRDWFTGYKALGNPARTAANGQPGFLALDHVGFSNATDGGVITAGPLAGLQFGPGGSILPFRPATTSSGILGIGGDTLDVAGRFSLLPKNIRTSVFGRVNYEVTDSLTLFAEGAWGKTTARYPTTPWVRFGNLRINADNPFIPAGLDLKGQAFFNIGRTNWDLGMPDVFNNRELTRIVAGVNGKSSWFNDSFRWNAYYEYGRSTIHNEITRNTIVANYNRAVDVVRNPAVGGIAGVAVGDPVCRSTLTAPNNGCVPLNPFGFGSPSAAAINYVNGIAFQDIVLREDVLSFDLQFEPFELPAGPLSIAAGAEYRRDAYRSSVDPLDASMAGLNPFAQGNFIAGRGAIKVKEGFAEAIAPIFKDAPFGKSLDVNAAIRVTDYNPAGRVTAWKVGATWDLNDQLRIRATRSRDIRAPNLNDLFLGGTASTIPALDAPDGTRQVLITSVSGGNPNLTPEIADTKALGVVFRPEWLPGLSASVDYYSIGINDAIVSQSAQTIINQCFGIGVPADAASCNNITLASPGTVANAVVRIGGANIAHQDTAGFDIEVGYRRDLADLFGDAPGAIDLRFLGTRVTKYESDTAGAVIDLLGIHNQATSQNGGAIKWRAMGSASYTLGPSATTITIRHVGPGVFSNFPPNNAQAIDKNRIGSATYVDLNENWDVEIMGGKAQIYAQIENLFDKAPPPVPSSQADAYADAGSAPVYFDLLGRSWRLGVRFQF